MTAIRLQINGAAVADDVPPRLSLADFLRERGHHATSARYFGQEMNWGNAAIGKINSVLHGLEADIKAGWSTITDPQFQPPPKLRRWLPGSCGPSSQRAVMARCG